MQLGSLKRPVPLRNRASRARRHYPAMAGFMGQCDRHARGHPARDGQHGSGGRENGRGEGDWGGLEEGKDGIVMRLGCDGNGSTQSPNESLVLGLLPLSTSLHRWLFHRPRRLPLLPSNIGGVIESSCPRPCFVMRQACRLRR